VVGAVDAVGGVAATTAVLDLSVCEVDPGAAALIVGVAFSCLLALAPILKPTLLFLIAQDF
jgi:hypothetical protein